MMYAQNRSNEANCPTSQRMPVISAQDDIIIPQHFSQFLFLVINHFVRSEIPHHLNISRAGGRCHFCAKIFRDLDCERAYPIRASRDEHLLPQLKVCALFERLPRSKSDHWNRRRLHEVQIGWFERGSVLRHDCKFGERTRSQIEDARENSIARPEAYHVTS